MSVMTIIPTTSERKNHAAIACARYNKENGSVVVVDQGGGAVLDGYVEDLTWIRTKHDNLLEQIRTGVDLALERGHEYVTLLDDDVPCLSLIEPSGNKYRIRSSKDSDDPDWRGALTEECLEFIDDNIEDWFPGDRSMLIISSRLFFPKENEEIPHVKPYGLDAFPCVFNDHVIWRTDRLDEVLRAFEALGVLNYSAGVDKAGAIINNCLGYTVGRLMWVRATKYDISGNENSTIYDFGETPMDLRNLHRNTEDAKSLRKIAPLVEKEGLSYYAKITKNGTLNSFQRTTTGETLEDTISNYLRRAEMKLLVG